MVEENIYDVMIAVKALKEAQLSAAQVVRSALGNQLRNWSASDWERVPDLVREADHLDRTIGKIVEDLEKLRNSVRGFLNVLKAMDESSFELADLPSVPDESSGRAPRRYGAQSETSAATEAVAGGRVDRGSSQEPSGSEEGGRPAPAVRDTGVPARREARRGRSAQRKPSTRE